LEKNENNNFGKDWGEVVKECSFSLVCKEIFAPFRSFLLKTSNWEEKISVDKNMFGVLFGIWKNGESYGQKMQISFLVVERIVLFTLEK
jgi:hypothetical protein